MPGKSFLPTLTGMYHCCSTAVRFLGDEEIINLTGFGPRCFALRGSGEIKLGVLLCRDMLDTKTYQVYISLFLLLITLFGPIYYGPP